MKKLLALLMVLTLVMGLCITSVSAQEQTVVRFWSHQNTAWNNSYTELIAEFEAENPDIKIEYTTFPYDDFEAKIQTSLIGSEAGADVYEVWGGWMLDFVDSGALSPTPDELVATLREDSYAPVLGTLQKDGVIYGAPVELNVEYGGLVVNKTLFEESGLSYPTTWDELLQTAKEVAVANGDMMDMRGLEFNQADNLVALWLSMILQKGGQYLMDDNTLDFTTDEAVESMQTLVDYVAVDHITNLDSATGSQGIDGHSFLGLGEAYMVVRGPWVLSDLDETYGMTYGVDYDYITLPAFEEGTEQTWVAETGWSLCVPKNTEVADAAWRFIEFLMEPENLLQHNIDCGQVPPLASVASDPAYLEAMPYMEALISILSEAQFIGPFNTDVFKTYVSQMYISLASDDGTYESVADGCQKLTEDLMNNMKMY